jgi:hypothetical protein
VPWGTPTQEVEREVVLYSQNLDYVMNTTYCRYHGKGFETINRTPQTCPILLETEWKSFHPLRLKVVHQSHTFGVPHYYP